MSSISLLRVKFLELENKQLQDKTLKLASQIGVLERALRNLQSVCNAEVKNKCWLFINVIRRVGKYLASYICLCITIDSYLYSSNRR